MTLYRFMLVLLLASMVGCQQKSIRPSPAPPSAFPVPVDVAGATRYQIDGAASTLHILVYRGGAMARFGHNHVVSSKNVQGTVFLQQNFTRSHLELMLPVASLVVDDAKARAMEGEDFAAEVPPEARDGTKRNLLRPEVLDAEHYPAVTLQSVSVGGTRERPELTLRVTIKQVTREIPVSAAVRYDADTLTATGELTIKQTDFGIAPFSAAFGALQVQDPLRIRFSIVCRQK